MKMRCAVKAEMVRTLVLALLAATLAGCASTANVALQHSFPQVVATPRDISAALVLDEQFQQYVGTPSKGTTIALGAAQTDLLKKVFAGLFTPLQVVDSAGAIAPSPDLVITPSVVEVQVAVPSDTYLNVYEVWVKYKLEIRTGDGEVLESWFMPAYGKTPDSMMLAREDAIRAATIVALRDAGAKLILDFYRVPSVQVWLARQGKVAEQ